MFAFGHKMRNLLTVQKIHGYYITDALRTESRNLPTIQPTYYIIEGSHVTSPGRQFLHISTYLRAYMCHHFERQ